LLDTLQKWKNNAGKLPIVHPAGEDCLHDLIQAYRIPMYKMHEFLDLFKAVLNALKMACFKLFKNIRNTIVNSLLEKGLGM